MKRIIITLAALLLAATPGRTAVTAQLAADGKALQPVIVSPNASPGTKASAAELADYLGRLTGANFEVRTGDGATGLAVGRAQDFPALKRQSCVRNRAIQGFELNTGHAYDAILARNKAAFEAHPEYLGLVGGVRKSTKFCISNPGLRQLVVNDALAQLAADPSKPSISIEPSDGGGWCECAACAKLGSATDRALTLANAVAAAVTAKYPGKLVGMYAYNEHSPPPSIRAHPAVVVSLAAGFIRGGFTIDQLLDGWSRQATALGIRKYYSVNPWDRDLPGAARAGNIEYLRQTIPHFHDKSARFLSVESGDNWGPNGLGYYLAARMLWDTRESARIDALTADFLDKAFGAAKEPMAKFYQLLDGAKRQPLSDDLIGRMDRLLDDGYLPKGTTLVGGFAQGTGELLNSSGKLALTLDAKPGYFSVPVPKGEDGRLWKFQRMTGEVFLLTVPPYLARNSRELLLPAEVVARDSCP